MSRASRLLRTALPGIPAISARHCAPAIARSSARSTIRSPAVSALISTRRQVLLTGGTRLFGSTSISHAAVQQEGVRRWVRGGVPQHRTMLASDADLLDAVKALVPKLSGENYKGQAGKIGTIGGCREYTGAPYFASISALKVGADLSHVFCTEGAATVIKSYSPELIVHPYLPDSQGRGGDGSDEVKRGVDAICGWLERFDVLVVGPGLGRDPWVQETVTQVLHELRRMEKPVVFDADSLHLVKTNLELMRGWRNAILTPNRNEFQRLASAYDIEVDTKEPVKQLQEVAAKYDGPIIVQKGPQDSISDGKQTVVCKEDGSPRRAGGQGDVLSGTLAAFTAWAVNSEDGGKAAMDRGGTPVLMLAAYGAACTVRHASRAAFERKRRSMLAADVIEELGGTVERLFDAH